MRGALGIVGFFGLCVGCFGVLSWIDAYNALMKESVIVATPQFILMSLDVLLDFMLFAVPLSTV